MQRYIGTKIINAKPMNRADYSTFRGWQLPTDGNGADEGYMVEYTDGGKPNVEGFAGYVSWSPKEQFEKAYVATENMNFGLALEAMQQGKKVARAGWNGKGMFLYHVPANSYPAQTELAKGYWGDKCAQSVNGEPTIMVPYGAYIAIKTAQENVLPWLASQADMLATDWVVVE